MAIYELADGIPLIVVPPEPLDDAPSPFGVDVSEFTSEIGARVQMGVGAKPNQQQVLEWRCADRQELKDVDDFLNLCAGRFKGFWLPTFRHDVWTLSSWFGGITIRDMGYTERLFPHTHFRRFYLRKWALEGHWTFSVDSAADNGDGTETLAGFIGFPYPLQWADVQSVNGMYSLLQYMRLDTDVVDYVHETTEVTTVRVTALHIPEEMP
jgi:hypothetical protein